MANRIEINNIPQISVLAMSKDPFEAVRVYDEQEKHYTDDQAKNDHGLPLWRARGQVIQFGAMGVQGNIEVAAKAMPRVEALAPFALKNPVVSIWSNRKLGELGVKVTAEVGE